MVIEKMRNIADLSIDKVYCCYFHEEGNLQVIDDVKENLKITRGQQKLIKSIFIKAGARCILH